MGIFPNKNHPAVGIPLWLGNPQMNKGTPKWPGNQCQSSFVFKGSKRLIEWGLLYPIFRHAYLVAHWIQVVGWTMYSSLENVEDAELSCWLRSKITAWVTKHGYSSINAQTYFNERTITKWVISFQYLSKCLNLRRSGYNMSCNTHPLVVVGAYTSWFIESYGLTHRIPPVESRWQPGIWFTYDYCLLFQMVKMVIII